MPVPPVDMQPRSRQRLFGADRPTSPSVRNSDVNPGRTDRRADQQQGKGFSQGSLRCLGSPLTGTGCVVRGGFTLRSTARQTAPPKSGIEKHAQGHVANDARGIGATGASHGDAQPARNEWGWMRPRRRRKERPDASR